MLFASVSVVRWNLTLTRVSANMSAKLKSVYLQSFDMVDDSNFCGVVHVECRGPMVDRKVFVRVTSNRWKDFTDIPARFMKANSDAELKVYCFQFSRSNKRWVWDGNVFSIYFQKLMKTVPVLNNARDSSRFVLRFLSSECKI